MRTELHNTHKDANVIIVNQLADLVVRGASNICVVCDDTDIFVLLIHFYCRENLNCCVNMESPVSGRCVMANKHRNITEYLPGIHALCGCSTTSYLHGTGKARALKALSSGMSLKLLGLEDVNMDDVLSEATAFIAMCCGSKYDGDMSEVHYDV